MSRIIVNPVRKGADAKLLGVPEDLAEEALVLVVVDVEDGEAERLGAGDVVLLGAGDEYGVYRGDKGCFELSRGADHGTVLVAGNIVGILKKFRG